jgi:L-lactate dehydrogenase (cytochrome)
MSVIPFKSVPPDCIVVHGKVYSLATFEHPGGQSVLAPVLGGEATVQFEKHHNVDLLSRVPCIGIIATNDRDWIAAVNTQQQRNNDANKRKHDLPQLMSILNVREFAPLAQRVLEPGTWAFYAAGADDEITLAENENAYRRFWLRPRVLRNVSSVDMTCVLLGTQCAFPLFISPTSVVKTVMKLSCKVFIRLIFDFLPLG